MRALCRVGWLSVHSGVGPRRARDAAKQLLAKGCTRLLVWGTAGGLISALLPGALILPATVIAPEGECYETDAGWRAILRRRINAQIFEQPLITQLRPLATHAEKEACARASGAVAVDQEASAVAAVAVEHTIPFVVLRSIVDPLDLDIPPVVLGASGDRLLGLQIAARLLARPQDLSAVLRLGRALRPARRALLQAAQAIATG